MTSDSNPKEMNNVIEASRSLIKQSQEFHKQILTVLPGIHCVVGYGLANSILIEGNDGNIIIDTLESREGALELKKDFQIISSKPVVAIIYTHHHPAHIFGAAVFAEENLNDIKVYAHAKTVEILDKTTSFVQPITFLRGARQFGTFLTRETGHINCGIGSFLNFNQNNTRAFLRPTDTFDTDSKKLTISGRDLILYHAPGETDDQIVIYMPKERVLFAADNIYKSFPNLYAIRGTPTRDARQWVSSLDLMRNLKAEYLIPSHTKPIRGEEEIYDIITKYRDAIQFVHDQTVRLINQGLTPDEIIGNQLIQLPKNLREHPYLQEFYGTVDWSIRGVFDRYLGWFSGKTSDLNVDAPKTRAKNLIKLGGGSEKVLEQAKNAYDEQKYQWVLELTEALNLYPENLNISQINQLACLTLQKLASQQRSANGRNWYLTKILEIQGLIHIKPSEGQITETILKASITNCFMLLSVNFNYQKAEGKNHLILFHFNDTNKKFSVQIRNGIADVGVQWPEKIQLRNSQMIVEVKTELIWKEIIARLKNPIQALENEEIIIKDGNEQDNPEGILPFLEFLLMFSS